tara:strand:- start:3920 stop:4633 length:714 start_codon:yes stop_codon:yes gene_type:complete
MDKERLLEGYFDNSLTVAEMASLEKLLAEDEEFAAEFAFEKNVKRAITQNERAELKAHFEALEKKNSKKIIPMHWLYVAASVVILAGFSIWVTFHESNSDQLYESYYQTYPNVVSPATRGPQEEDIQSKAFAAYDDGNYHLAVDLFEEIYQQDKLDFALFYKGLSELELRQFQNARASFQLFDFSKSNSFTPYFKWYLALADLKTGNRDEAKDLLIELSLKENPMQEMAKNLLEELN